MNLEQIQEEIKKALAGSKTLLLEKYVNSDKEVKDFVIELLPDDGYNNLVRESMEIINNNAGLFISELRPADANLAEWATAVAEQLDSFKKSLEPDKVQKDFKVNKPMVKVDGMFLYDSEFKAGNVSTVIIKNAKILSFTNHSEPNEGKLPKSNVARYKYIIRSRLPISKYVAQFVLNPLKVESVKAVSV